MPRPGYESSAEHLGPNGLLGSSVLAEEPGFASTETIARFHGADAADVGRFRRPAVATRTVVADMSGRERLARPAVAFADGPPRSRRGTR